MRKFFLYFSIALAVFVLYYVVFSGAAQLPASVTSADVPLRSSVATFLPTRAVTARPTLPPNLFRTTAPTRAPTRAPFFYVLNTSTKVFHYSSCWHIKQMDSRNKKIDYRSRWDIIMDNYKPCGDCKP